MKKVYGKYYKPGIYMLRSKTDPELFYIGGAENVINRKCDHISKLRANSSGHYKIVEHIKKYGIEDLEFNLIEYCSLYSLYEREQYYISELNPTLNSFKFASCKLGESGQKCAYNDFVKENMGNLVEKEYVILQYCDKEFMPEIINFNIL